MNAEGRSRLFQVSATKCLFDSLIDNHADAYLKADPSIKEFSNYEKSGTRNYYIGMVWTNQNEKPDVQQLRIRGSQTLANNRMLELDLSALDSTQSFFPGQIIAFLADPHQKKQLTVRKILDPMLVSPHMKSVFTTSKISLFIACGPFMKPDQDDWTLYDQMIDSIRANEATHVILIGPFVDLENKPLRSNYDVNWRIFFDRLMEKLFDYSCEVHLVPSSRDTLPSYLNATYFYPSPELKFDFRFRDKAQASPKCKVIGVTDPAQIDLGGIFLDVTSIEVLFQLNRCTSFINKSGNAFSSIYRHIITQGIYPMYPHPNDVAIDQLKLSEHLQLDRLAPHILVLPSRFNTSVTNQENRLIVAIKKFSTTKQALLIEIPPCEVPDVTASEYSYKTIDIQPKEEKLTEEGTVGAPTTADGSSELVGSKM